ncbi:regulator of g-protein signaling loco [Holotrichia oblita]|uniref:Regulator of g-protein signaling loco n=1 Tax=Holotrichia oblita TaxID=644536 RepID=A0ACB9TMD4_HOLOL|nr:regulator of g-protein signaling loco [Holotrichia oblita]
MVVVLSREGNNIGGGLVVSLRPPFKRLNSFRRVNSNTRPKSILAPPDVVPQVSILEQNLNTYNTSQFIMYNIRLDLRLIIIIKINIHFLFQAFLKKEFSAENIYFWTACERFKQLVPSQEKKHEAERIYQQHLCVGATEAVNVDSQARQFAELSLQKASNDTFELAQKQIFNLMKFDSYPRFLKSDLYKQCLSGNTNGLEIDNSLLTYPVPTGTPSKLKKSLSNAEDRRRKSLLPWHRKNRTKSKDRGEMEYNKKADSAENVSGSGDKTNDVHSSKSSLTSLDFTTQDPSKGNNVDDTANLKVPLCRVIMPSSGCTVVKIKESETIQQLMDRLLVKRGLTFRTYDVTTDNKLKDLDLNESSMKLNGCTVFVEQKVCFKLDLPNRKIINIKSKPTKILVDVVRQILLRYNYKLEDVTVTLDNNATDMGQLVTSVENCKLSVQLKECETKHTAALPSIKVLNTKFSNLDDITNKVYEDILQEKAEIVCNKQKSDKSSVKSEDWGSEHSSGIFGKFLRRDSGVHDKKKKPVIRNKGNSTNSSTEDVNADQGNKKLLIAKFKPGVRVQMAYSESDELYEGLSRAQRFRLEDQRGTEINFELPDFLKDKEHNQLVAGNTRKLRRPEEHIFENSRFYTDATIVPKQEKPAKHSNYENRTILPSENNNVNIINNNCYGLNNHNHHSNTNNPRIIIPKRHNTSSDDSCSSSQSTPNKNSLDNTIIENKHSDTLNTSKGSDPPPLPPKPKILPIRPSNWGQNGFLKNETSPRKDSSKNGLYLEQPTSSFV